MQSWKSRSIHRSFVAVIAVALAGTAVATKLQAQDKPAAAPVSGDSMPNVKTLSDGLKIETVALAGDDGAKNGDTVWVHYTGTLTDGKKFDSSLDRGEPIQFQLGAGNVIKGWDEGIAGMKIGEKRKLTIPPELGYGARGTPGGPIPPNATLLFDVQLVGLKQG